jgi:uncharacterized protein with beta-barrel porin domain
MKWMHAVLVASGAGLSPTDFVVAKEAEPIVIERDHHIDTPVVIDGEGAFDVRAGQTLTVAGPIQGAAGDPFGTHRLFKLGGGHLSLQGESDRSGGTVLLRGSLGLESGQALGASHNTLTMVGGTRLHLADGLTMQQSLDVLRDDPTGIIPDGWTLDDPADGTPAPVRVESGEAILTGHVTLHAPLVKDGSGTLRLTELSQSVSGDALTVRAGGLRVDGLWLFGAIHTEPGTVLSGSGYLHEASVAGRLQPGGPDTVGTLMFDQRLQLAPTAQTRIRIDAAGASDRLFTWGTLRPGGELLVEPTPGRWTPQTRWTIAQAEGGVDANARFARATSTLRYLDPVLTYAPSSIVLGLRYNDLGLNGADGAWRGALIEDSRFVRESALAHTAGGRLWAQTWAANAERAPADGLPGDDRDTAGLQVGVSRAIGDPARTSGAWHMAAFAGAQSTDLSSRFHPMAPRYGARDAAAHVGLGLSRTVGGLTLTAGAAHAWHHARLRRQADPAEPDLRSRARARLSQVWLESRPERLLGAGNWELVPHAQAAWISLHRPTVRESGGLAAVTLAPRTEHRWTSHLGLQTQRRWPVAHGQAILSASVGLHSHWGARSLRSPQAYQADPGRSLDAESPGLTRHSLRLDIGARAPIARNIHVGLAYTGQYGGGQRQHGVWLGVSVTL